MCVVSTCRVLKRLLAAVSQVESLLKGNASDAITFERIHGKRQQDDHRPKTWTCTDLLPRGLPEEVRPDSLKPVTCSGPVMLSDHHICLLQA